MSMNVFGYRVAGRTAIQSYALTKFVGNNKTLGEMREEKIKELGGSKTMLSNEFSEKLKSYLEEHGRY